MYHNNKIKIKPVLEPQEANKNNKMLKISEKIFFGGNWGPPKTPKIAKKGFWGAPNHPQKIFFHQFSMFYYFKWPLGIPKLLFLFYYCGNFDYDTFKIFFWSKI